MSVITTDTLIEGIRRDDVLAWLSNPDSHDKFLQGAFDDVKRTGERTWELTVKMVPKSRVIGYEILQLDESHGGRRLLCRTTGKRTAGELHYSLRTMKPSTNTLVTLHADFGDGGILGQISEQLGLRKRLDEGFKAMLDNLHRAIKGGA